MSWLFKSEEQRKKEKADRAQWAEWERQSQEFASKLNEKARNRKERLARGEQVRRIVQAGYAPGAFDEEWHTAEEWAEINAKRSREEEEKYAPIRRAREKEKKNAEITKCRQVIAEANAVTGGNRTKKYRKNKNKNTKKYRKNKNKNTRRKH